VISIGLRWWLWGDFTGGDSGSGPGCQIWRVCKEPVLEKPFARLKGACLCGRINFEVSDAFEYAANCHCSQCRKATGAAFKPFVAIPREKFVLKDWPDDCFEFGTRIEHDLRCRNCGSLIYSRVRDGEYLHIPLGVLTDTPSLKPDKHIFVGSKADWHDILDDLPQHEEF
tara:strand:+ start:40 stop:549 length:510 start_codon:yes stop_codon:yes gene_type:complete